VAIGEQEQGTASEGKRARRSEHRASYTLERGVWIATCRSCGWRARDEQRRQAATLFRQHITDMRELPVATVIDLTDDSTALVNVR
jgi:hypothetical protein